MHYQVKLKLTEVLWKLDGVARLIADPPTANFTTLYSRLLCQDIHICIGKPPYLTGTAKRP